MQFFAGLLNLLAEAEATPAADAKPEGGPPGGMLWVAIPMLVVWFLLMRPNKKQELSQKSMLDNLKQNDRVVTTSGIYGIVTNVQRDSDRVTLRIDDSNNTKISVTLASIARVLVDTPDADKDKSAK